MKNKNAYNINDLNENLANIKKIIKKSEQSYTDKINNVVDTILNNNLKMVLISGPSGSGKTTTSNKISEALLQHNIGSLVVSIDDFFIDLKDTPLLDDGMPDFENIKCVDIKTFNKFCKSILKKQKAKMPRYDFINHKRGGYETVKINKEDVIIVEGIHVLNPLILQHMKFQDQLLKLYVCVDSVFSYNDKITIREQDLRLMRRTYRDAFTRNHSPEKTFNQWKHVCEGENIYIAPYKSNADIIIDTTRDYEVMVYANYLPILLQPYTENPQIKKVVNQLKHIEKIDKKIVPKDSMLWEFLVNKE